MEYGTGKIKVANRRENAKEGCSGGGGGDCVGERRITKEDILGKNQFRNSTDISGWWC